MPLKKMPSVRESDLYPQAAAYFMRQGFEVKGEVCSCDLVAIKDDTIIIAELKLTFNIKLLYQAVRRLMITEQVYVVIPKPKKRQKMSYWQMMKSLCRRLHLGLLIIDNDDVLVLAEPKPFNAKISARHKKRVFKEFHGRKVAQNAGGTTGIKLETAYLEAAVHISILLKKHKALKPKELVALGTTDKTARLLYNNHYGWFEKNIDGAYKLKRGKAKIIKNENPRIWDYYTAQVSASE